MTRDRIEAGKRCGNLRRGRERKSSSEAGRFVKMCTRAQDVRRRENMYIVAVTRRGISDDA